MVETPLKILVVDDEWILREMLSEILDDAGYAVESAEDGEEAWQTFQEVGDFALIISDINMPRMDGNALIKKIRHQDQDIPIIILTSSNEISVAVQAINHGASDYLLKDENMHDMVRISVRKVLRMHEISMENRQLLADVSNKNNELKDALDRVRKTHEDLQVSQSRLVQSEKMASLGRLVAGVAHEINTPIGIGLTAATHLAAVTREINTAYQGRSMKKSHLERYFQQATENTSLVQSNLERTADLIQSFKMVSSDQVSQQQRPFVLKNYLDDILQSLKPRLKKTAHSLRVECPLEVTLNSFPGAFAQVITNLIMNSLFHAYNEGDQGEICISVEPLGTERIRLLYQDDGKGIAPEYREKIFDPFFTTRRGEGGTGLGLNIVFNVVHQTLGGEIECHSEIGAGTTFILLLPVTVKAKTEEV